MSSGPQLSPSTTRSRPPSQDRAANHTSGKQELDFGADPLTLLTGSPESIAQLQRMIGNRAATRLIGRGAAEASQPTDLRRAVIQRVKARVQRPQQNPGPPPTLDVGVLRAYIANVRAQIQEYVGYPDEITQAEGINVEAEVNTLEQTLNTVVNDMQLNDNSAIGQPLLFGHYNNNTNWRALANAAQQSLKGINARYDAWEQWHMLNPDSVDELDDQVPAEDLGLDDEGAIIGEYVDAGMIFKSYPTIRLPLPATGDEQERYYKFRTKREKIEQLRGDVATLPTNVAAQIPHTWSLRTSPSGGATRMRTILQGNGDIICNRVMSTGEADKVRESGGDMIAKLAASKWFTMGAAANINSSGDNAHSQAVEWTVDGAFRNVLTMPGMHCYNENEDGSDSYQEPYWVWKDNEAGNIAISPVLTAIFNDMVRETRINGEPV